MTISSKNVCMDCGYKWFPRGNELALKCPACKSSRTTIESSDDRRADDRRAEVDAALKDVDFSKNTYQVEFETTMGKILLDVYPDVAPGHANNLIGLTKIGFYNGIIFHRVISGFMIQVGCPQGTGTGGPGYTIKQEFSSKPHDAGVLSMARTSDPNSAGSQFFICLTRDGTKSLDNQYTVFGKTADKPSLDVVLKIGSVPTGSGDRPKQEVKITSSRVIVTPKG